MPIDLYLSDVTSDVKMSKLPNGNYFLEGLPILQTGTWNGKPYTEDDLQQTAQAFSAIQEQDKWEPPIRGYHAYDREGKPLQQDARNTLGWFKGARYDPDTTRLLTDIEVPKEQTARDIVDGTLRFVSAEIARDCYKSPVTNTPYPRALVGAAFVDNPAVKGMPWQIVLNAAEYGHEGDDYEDPQDDVDTFAMMTTDGAGMKESLLPDSCFLIPDKRQLPYRDADPESEKDEMGRHMKAGPVNCGRMRAAAGALKGARGSKITADDLSPTAVRRMKAAAKACGMTSSVIDELSDDTAGSPGNAAGDTGAKGAKSMKLIDVLKAKFAALGAKPEDLADLDQFEALAAEPAPETPPAAPPVAGAAPPADDGLRRQVDQFEQTIKEQQAQIETLATERRRDKAEATVNEWVLAGKLPPALRVPTFALLDTLSALPAAEIDVLAQDAEGNATSRKATAVDLLGEIITGIAPAINTGKPRGNILTLATDDPEQVTQMTTDDHKRMAALAGGGADTQ